MSFSRAKLQRFNETKDCTPSPAKYNVSISEKIKSGVISQQGKCPKSQSGSETGSVHSTPCFQTPTIPKKKKFLGLGGFKSSSKPSLPEQQVQEELREKTVECKNKDAYIKDLTEQLEEMSEKIGNLEQEKQHLLTENETISGELALSRKRQSEFKSKHVEVHAQVQEINATLHMIRQDNEVLKFKNRNELTKLSKHLDKFQHLYCEMVKKCQAEACEMQEKLKQEHQAEVERLNKEIEAAAKKLSDSEAKVKLLEENFKEVSLLAEIQMREKVEEIEANWQLKVEAKEKEYEAILKECQEISEYNIIQSEIEKNLIKNSLQEKEAMYNELLEKHTILEANYNKINEEMNDFKNEKYAYELSITTFRDTIEVLKKRLMNSDRDVEQLKEELGKCEEKILKYETKITELSSQLNETQDANEELEMQYESTSKIMQNQVKSVEKDLLAKVEGLQGELKQLVRDKQLLNEVLQQYHEQQSLITKAQDTILQASTSIETLEKKQKDLQLQVDLYETRLIEEAEEAAKIRKKYIEKSGQFDELTQQYEELLKELKQTKEANEELQGLIRSYQEQLEAYDQELKILMNEKEAVTIEAKDLTEKYADILSHQNHKQKIKHLVDLKGRSSELFEKNIDLEARNMKLNKLVEKLKKEVEDLKKGKKVKIGSEDKENMGSPQCLKSVQSPGPLKSKN